MATRIKLPPKDSGARVELGQGSDVVEFKVKPMTLDLEEEINALMRAAAEVETNPDSKPLDFCEAEVAQLDVLLEPVATPAGDRERTCPTVPSEILLGDEGDETADPPRPRRPGYKTNDVTRSQIRAMCQRVLEAARPT